MQSKARQKNRYEKIKHLGEGQFANVYKAKDLENGDFVAVKKIKLGSTYEARDGINRTALREIKLLQEIHHDNVITLRDVLGHRTSIQLVFDFMDTDLENLVKNMSIVLTLPHIKNITLQMLLGLEHLHINYILHRDLKPNNLLMNASGRIKLADFGLARFFGSPNRIYTHQVVTRWYRSPELLYGARAYGTGVDMWAVGCIIGELLCRNPIMAGESDLDQLIKIFTLLGPLKEEDWPGYTSLPDFVEIKECGDGYALRDVFTAASEDLLELIAHCLYYNPLRRWSATEALQSAYFRSEPYACADADLPLGGDGDAGSRQSLRKRRAAGDGADSARRRLDF